MSARRLSVATYINQGPGMFIGYQPGDRLIVGPQIELAVEDCPEPELRALDYAWALGNRVGVDADGRSWPRTVRSLSVGDVLVVGNAVYAVAPIGFERITAEQLAHSLSAGITNPRLRQVGS